MRLKLQNVAPLRKFFYAYFYLQTNILIFALGFGNQFLISEHFYFSINLSGGGEPHSVIEDGHR